MGPVVPPVRSGATAPLTQKLSQFVPLAADEIPLLLDLQSGSRFVRRGQEIITEGRTYRTLFIVLEGVAIRYRVLRDGRRQVLNVVLPGDVAGVPGCFFESALYSVRAITDAWVSPVPLAGFVTPVTVIGSPSGSKSLARTAIVTGLAVVVLAMSSLTIGG